MRFHAKGLATALAASALFLSAAAQAIPYNYSHVINDATPGAVTGTVSATFNATDANTNGLFETSEISWLTLSFMGSGAFTGTNLNYTLGEITTQATTALAVGDVGLGNFSSGLWLTGTQVGTTMVYVAGPANLFGFGPNAPGDPLADPQNSGILFGDVTLFPAVGSPQYGASQLHASVTPVPEPQTYLMMLAGIAVLGAAARRKAKAA